MTKKQEGMQKALNFVPKREASKAGTLLFRKKEESRERQKLLLSEKETKKGI